MTASSASRARGMRRPTRLCRIRSTGFSGMAELIMPRPRRGQALADGVVERQGAQCDDIAGSAGWRPVARRLAVGRGRRGPVPGRDAALAAAVHHGVHRDDAPSSRMRTSLAVLCTSTGRRRVVSGTL